MESTKQTSIVPSLAQVDLVVSQQFTINQLIFLTRLQSWANEKSVSTPIENGFYEEEFRQHDLTTLWGILHHLDKAESKRILKKVYDLHQLIFTTHLRVLKNQDSPVSINVTLEGGHGR